MNDGGMDGQWFGLVEADVVVTPVMGEVRADEDDITGLKTFDVVADELSTAALMKEDQFHFDMVVPAVIDERVPVFPYAERVGGGAGDFEEFGLHGPKIRESAETGRRESARDWRKGIRGDWKKGIGGGC